MKSKQVTFSEALELMMSGKVAYRVNDGRFEFENQPGQWVRSAEGISIALSPWFIEVEPMKHSFEQFIGSDPCVRVGLPAGWENKVVRITVEEINEGQGRTGEATEC